MLLSAILEITNIKTGMPGMFQKQQDHSTLDKPQNNNTDNKVIMYDDKNFVTFPQFKKKFHNIQFAIFH